MDFIDFAKNAKPFRMEVVCDGADLVIALGANFASYNITCTPSFNFQYIYFEAFQITPEITGETSGAPYIGFDGQILVQFIPLIPSNWVNLSPPVFNISAPPGTNGYVDGYYNVVTPWGQLAEISPRLFYQVNAVGSFQLQFRSQIVNVSGAPASENIDCKVYFHMAGLIL